MTQEINKLVLAKSVITAYANQGLEPAKTLLRTYEQILNTGNEFTAARYIVDVHKEFQEVLQGKANTA